MDLTILWALLDFMNSLQKEEWTSGLGNSEKEGCVMPPYMLHQRGIKVGVEDANLPILKQRICIVGPHSQAKGMCFLPNPFAPKLGQKFWGGFC